MPINEIIIIALINDSWGLSIGKINIPGNGDGKTSQIITSKIKKVNGVHAVWLRFWGDYDDLVKIDSFSFF
jgi:arabinoxylan arabinofuranohydrolase